MLLFGRGVLKLCFCCAACTHTCTCRARSDLLAGPGPWPKGRGTMKVTRGVPVRAREAHTTSAHALIFWTQRGTERSFVFLLGCSVSRVSPQSFHQQPSAGLSVGASPAVRPPSLDVSSAPPPPSPSCARRCRGSRGPSRFGDRQTAQGCGGVSPPHASWSTTEGRRYSRPGLSPALAQSGRMGVQRKGSRRWRWRSSLLPPSLVCCYWACVGVAAC